jgi:hypothetical protein
MSSDKRQFLDPISTISKIILLHFYPQNTKLRILDHTVQLVGDSYMDIVTRNWYKDNRGDVCFLYPIFIRYIKLYLIEKQKKSGKSCLTDKQDSELSQEELALKYLKKIAEYSIFGMQELQKTYGYDNVVFTLQYFISLMKSGINNNFNDELLPDNLKELSKNNLLDDSKVLNIWEDAHVIELGRTFEACFNAENKKDQLILNSNKKKIMDILEIHDGIFKKMLESDGSL